MIHAEAKGYRRPVIVTNVDEGWNAAEVDRLLLFAKRVGAEANFVSAAVSSYDIPITIEQLRCSILKVSNNVYFPPHK